MQAPAGWQRAACPAHLTQNGPLTGATQAARRLLNAPDSDVTCMAAQAGRWENVNSCVLTHPLGCQRRGKCDCARGTSEGGVAGGCARCKEAAGHSPIAMSTPTSLEYTTSASPTIIAR